MNKLLVIACATLSIISAAIWVIYRVTRRHHRKAKNTGWLSQQLEAARSQSDIILNAIEDGVVVIDTNKTIQLFNPAASRLTGWGQDEALGLDHTNVLTLLDDHNNPYTPSQNPFIKVLEEGKTARDNNAILLSRNKKQTSINLSVSPLVDQKNNISGAVGIFRDVSEEKKQEQQRAEFVSTASHEMRTPVAAIEGYLALAMNDKVSHIDSKARSYLEKAHSSTQHLGKLFQDLLTSAKAEDGRLSNHPSVIEMSAFMDKLVEDLRFTAQKKGLKMEHIIGTGDGAGKINNVTGEGSSRIVTPLYYVNADPDRIREVITNLFDNAVKYTDSGTISLGLTGNDQVVQIYIKDSGNGIPSEDIPHLFQKFYRVDNSATRAIGGTGLGLFICRKIIELYEGKIWVESQLGEGSTFYINLPRLSSQKASELQIANSTNNNITTPSIAAGIPSNN